jgi:hypothetical protein
MSTQHFQLDVQLSFNQIIEIVKQLSPIEKQKLSEVLISDQDFDNVDISDEHKQIVRQRVKKAENAPDSYLTWTDIEQKMAIQK